MLFLEIKAAGDYGLNVVSRIWDSYTRVPCLKPLGGCLVDSTFHLFMFDKMSIRTPGDFMVKSNQSIHKRGSSIRNCLHAAFINMEVVSKIKKELIYVLPLIGKMSIQLRTCLVSARKNIWQF